MLLVFISLTPTFIVAFIPFISSQLQCWDYSNCSACYESNHDRVNKCVWYASINYGFCIEETLQSHFERLLPSITKRYFKELPFNAECKNGHLFNCSDSAFQQCKVETEKCLPNSPTSCECTNDHVRVNGVCIPQCIPECAVNKGRCILPYQCLCRRGFYSDTCDSNCSNGERRSKSKMCLPCLNKYATGSLCDSCEPPTIGDPVRNISCRTCDHYCNGHTNVCDMKTRETDDTVDINCHNCGGHTRGLYCQNCESGYFRYYEQPVTTPCEPCRCGLSQSCNPQGGLDCVCTNMTKSPNYCAASNVRSKELAAQCIELQCSECLTGYGKPIDGMQCYPRMLREEWYCLQATCALSSRCLLQRLPHGNYDTSEFEDDNPFGTCSRGLLWGQTQLLAIQPVHSNLKLNVFLDILQGRVDVYFAASFEPFRIYMNQSTYQHRFLLKLQPHSYGNSKKFKHFEISSFTPRYQRLDTFQLLNENQILHIAEITGPTRVILQAVPSTKPSATSNYEDAPISNLPLDTVQLYLVLVPSNPSHPTFSSSLVRGQVTFHQVILHMDALLGVGIVVAMMAPLLVLNLTVCSWRNQVRRRGTRLAFNRGTGVDRSTVAQECEVFGNVDVWMDDAISLRSYRPDMEEEVDLPTHSFNDAFICHQANNTEMSATQTTDRTYWSTILIQFPYDPRVSLATTMLIHDYPFLFPKVAS